MTTPAKDLEELKRHVLELTHQNWEKTGKALLLASLGQTLGRAGHDLRAELRGQKMVPFLQFELADRVRVLTSPHDRLVLGVVPADAAIGDDVAALFKKERKETEEKGVRFDRRVWMAFSRPVAPGCVRALFWEPELRFEDVPKEASAKITSNVVPEHLIVPVGALPSGERNAALQENIKKWLEEHGVDFEVARAMPVSADQPATYGGSALSALFRALDARDLARISMPLDIVAKLMETKASRDK
jgi:hypothetical protein